MLPKLPTIEEAARLMRQKELTPLDLVEHCLGRIEQFEDRIHAWVLVDEEGARMEARRQTDMLARGEDLGPLHGIPIGIKDIIDVAGWQTRCGSKLRENVAPAEKDATVVANLRNAGAIILGKTVTTEFACFDPPPTRNPWNLDHTPGGSSSGSAAAVAMEMCLAALGTQTGGSIIRPAAYCGVCGFKPGLNAPSVVGVMPLTLHLDHVGPIARCVRDAITMAQAAEDEPKFLSRPHDGGRPWRLGVCEEFFKQSTSPEVWERFAKSVETLGTGGCVIELAELPARFEDSIVMHRRIMAAEASALHRREFEDHAGDYSPKVASLIKEGLAMRAVDYAEALVHQKRVKYDFLRMFKSKPDNQFDAILMPSTPTTAPSTDTTGDPVFNSPWSYARVPAATIPVGVNTNGLPIGMQIVGYFDSQLLSIVSTCEGIIHWDKRPPLLKEAN